MTFRSSIELLIPLDVDVLEIWVLPCGVGDNISSSRNCDTSITDIKKRDMITFLGQEMWGPLPLTFLGQEMLSCQVSCIEFSLNAVLCTANLENTSKIATLMIHRHLKEYSCRCKVKCIFFLTSEGHTVSQGYICSFLHNV